MIHISFFLECKNDKEVLKIVKAILNEITPFIDSYKILSNEPYWKIDGWFVTRCRLNAETMGKQQAQNMLDRISDRWQWTPDSAYSSAENMGTNFIHPLVKFIDCVFDEIKE